MAEFNKQVLDGLLGDKQMELEAEIEAHAVTLRALQDLDETNGTLVDQREEARAEAARYRNALISIRGLRPCDVHGVLSERMSVIALEALSDV